MQNEAYMRSVRWLPSRMTLKP